MNQFAARKLGEVLAFCQVGVETLERGKDGLVAGLGETAAGEIEKAITTLNDHAAQIEKVAQEAGVFDTTSTKAQGTGTKLRSMRDMYIGDEWDNAAEVLEWMGFFEGAAIVHFALVEGAGEALSLDHLKDLADDGKEFHEDMLKMVQDSLHKIGGQKAAAA